MNSQAAQIRKRGLSTADVPTCFEAVIGYLFPVTPESLTTIVSNPGTYAVHRYGLGTGEVEIIVANHEPVDADALMRIR